MYPCSQGQTPDLSQCLLSRVQTAHVLMEGDHATQRKPTQAQKDHAHSHRKALPQRNLNPGPSWCEARVLTTAPPKPE